jgi:hypothetical protein
MSIGALSPEAHEALMWFKLKSRKVQNQVKAGNYRVKK